MWEVFFFFQAEDGIRDVAVTGVQTCALPILISCLSFGLCLSAFAQTDRGTITGTVTDSSGAVIAGVKVTVTNAATGVSFETATSQAGLYTIPQVKAGTYRGTFVQTGFKKSVSGGVIVPLGETVRADASLQGGEVFQTSESTAEAPLLKTNTSEL